MNKDEILEKSRKENNNKDLAEMNVVVQAGNIAGRVGACICCLLSIISLRITNIFLCSPWIIYFSILGTNYLVRFVKVIPFLSTLFDVYHSICIFCNPAFGRSSMKDELKLKNHLKEVRTEKNLSQAQLAELVGVSRNTISSIETGQFNPTAKLALILCIALDKKFEDLFYF